MHEDIPILNFLVPKEVHPRGRPSDRHVFEKVAPSTTTRAAAAGADRRAGRAYRVRRRAGRRRPGERLPLDRARHRHRVRPLGHAGGRRGHLAVDPPEGVLRRRRRVRAEEHHLGGRARPRGRHLHRQALPRRGRRRRARRRRHAVSARRWASTSGATTTTISHRPALQGAAPRQGGGAERHQGRGRARLRSASWPSRRRSAA